MLPTYFLIGGINLTITEVRIMVIFCYCTQLKEVAIYQNRSVNTIYGEAKKIYAKLNVAGCVEMHRFSILNGLRNNGYVQGHYLFDQNQKMPWKHEIVMQLMFDFEQVGMGSEAKDFRR